jgi:hypothetical protein
MKDMELNEVLKRAAVPERGADYWERFPARVTAEIDRRKQESCAERSLPGAPRKAASVSNHWSWASVVRSLGGKPAFALGLATACVALGFVLGFWKGPRSPVNEPQLAEVRKYFREIEALFPNQLQAIIFDQQGTHLVLTREPNLPASPPLYLKVCGPKGCQRFVTFSGQQIQVNGEVCDVLADHEGNVLLVGRQLLWSGSRAVARSGPYQIEARALETTL